MFPRPFIVDKELLSPRRFALRGVRFLNPHTTTRRSTDDLPRGLAVKQERLYCVGKDFTGLPTPSLVPLASWESTV